MKKRVMISTFNNSLNNYGAIFQSYALSKTIERLGHSPVFLNLGNREIHNLVPQKRTLKQKIKSCIVKVLSVATKRQRDERAEKFRSFVRKNQVQICYDTFEELEQSPPKADVYLSGSDQVWNPKSLHKELFLSFAPDDAPLVSYAASMGNETIPEANKELFAKYISRYDAVSVREDTIPPIIREYTDKEIHQHIDPVFLLEGSEWQKIAKPYEKLRFKKYILMYIIEFDKKLIGQIKALKKEMGLPVVLITLGGLKRSFADQVVMNASPEEFLYLLSGAEMVVASSFHGCALSIIFNKPFISISGKDKPTRIESLLRHFKLEEHNNAVISMENATVDYEAINTRIKADRAESEKYLADVLSMEK